MNKPSQQLTGHSPRQRFCGWPK